MYTQATSQCSISQTETHNRTSTMSSGPTNEIPVLDYTSFDDHRDRLATLSHYFRTAYGVRPDFFVCVPGR